MRTGADCKERRRVPVGGLAMQMLGGRSQPVSPENIMVQQGPGAKAGQIHRGKILKCLRGGLGYEPGPFPKHSEALSGEPQSPEEALECSGRPKL